MSDFVSPLTEQLELVTRQWRVKVANFKWVTEAIWVFAEVL